MDPIEIAQNLKILCDNFSREEVARRLGISNKGTLWVYLRLLGLPSEVQDLVKKGKLGQDAAYRITIRLNKKEQIALANAIIQHNLTSNEIKGIVQALKRRNREMPIDEAVSLTLKARPTVTAEHVIVIKIEKTTLDSLKSKAECLGISVQELLRDTLLEVVPPSNLNSIRTTDQIVFLSVNEEGYRILRKLAKKERVKMENLVNFLAKKRMSSDN